MDSLIDQKILTASVVDITWERIFLHIKVRIAFSENADRKAPLNFYFVNGIYQARGKGKIESVEDDVYSIVINITNQGEQRCLPLGNYSLIVCQDNKQMAKAVVGHNMIKRLADCSRNFLYSGKSKVYSITFYITEGEDDLPFTMFVMPSARTGVGAPAFKGKKHEWNPVTAMKKSYYKNYRKNMVKIYRFLYKMHDHKKKNVIMFFSEQGKTIGTNMKPLKERMIARGMDKEYEIIESYRSINDEPNQGKKSWLTLLNKLAKADIVIMEDHAPVLDWLTLNDNTKVIQLWHAGAGFKSSGYSRWGHIGCPAPWSCHRQYDYGIAGSKRIAHFFSEVWGINDARVLPTGMPRIDQYLDADYRAKTTKQLYEKYPMSKGKKVILFAPTYRGKNKGDAHYPYELIDFDRLSKVCGEDTIVLFKMHPWVAAGVPIPEKYKDKFVDVGKYPNINDLFYITDLLITDYSSNIFEYSLMRKPMLFFAFDEIQYSFSRGFHRDYRLSAPGKVCVTFDELLTAIEQKDFEYEKVEEYVANQFDYIDSNACDRVIDWLVLGNIPEEIQKEIAAEDAVAKEFYTLDFTPKEEN